MEFDKPLKGLNVILDRDGTVIAEKHYLSAPEQVELLPGVAAALRRLCRAGARLFIVTNQSGIGRGYFSLDAYEQVAARLSALLKAEGVELEATLFCPHAPADRCACRKPDIGMWLELSRKFALAPEQSVMIGDKMDDIRFGLNSGLAAVILVLTGHGRETAAKYGFRTPASAAGVCAPTALSPNRPLHRQSAAAGTGPAAPLAPDAPDAPAPHLIAHDLPAAADWIMRNLRQDRPCA